MKIDKEQLFGIIIMLAGSYAISDGIINAKLSFAITGFVLFGFAIFLWTAETGEGTSIFERE